MLIYTILNVEGGKGMNNEVKIIIIANFNHKNNYTEILKTVNIRNFIKFFGKEENLN